MNDSMGGQLTDLGLSSDVLDATDSAAPTVEVTSEAPAKKPRAKAKPSAVKAAKKAKTVLTIVNVEPEPVEAPKPMPQKRPEGRDDHPTHLFRGPARFVIHGFNDVVDGETEEENRMLIRVGKKIALIVICPKGTLKSGAARVVEGMLSITRFQNKDRWATPVLRLCACEPKAILSVRRHGGQALTVPQSGGSTLMLGSNEYRLASFERATEQTLAA